VESDESDKSTKAKLLFRVIVAFLVMGFGISFV
jgi:hypothetical protein